MSGLGRAQPFTGNENLAFVAAWRKLLGPRMRPAILHQLARLGLIAGAAIALAACTPAEPTGLAADREPAAALVSAPTAPKVAAPIPAAADTRLGKLIDGAPQPVVAGERLNVELLRRFYARHGFEPVWTTRQAQANSLMNAVLRAGEHGLAPE